MSSQDASDLIIRIAADLAPLMTSLSSAERLIAASGGKLSGMLTGVDNTLTRLTGSGQDLRRALENAIPGLDGKAAAQRAIAADTWRALSREAERDYVGFWERITQEQTARAVEMSGRSQRAVRELTGQRYMGPLSQEVRSDYESLWGDLLSERDAAQAQIIRHNEDLRAGFDPLFAAQLTYQRRLAEIDDALARNAISEDVAAKARKTASITHQQQARALDQSAWSMGKVALAAGAAWVAMQGMSIIAEAGRQAVQTAVRFDALEGSLQTVTGSALAARGVFDVLQQFGAKTPYSVEEATRAFIALKARGLDPSIPALQAYGNTASAFTTSLMDMVEAVAAATTGEFERLKAFGIDAAAQGDRIVFTFKGVSTEVKRNAADIEAYLRRIGEVDFAGAMEQQAARMGGALSNMGDSADRFLARIGRSLPVELVATGWATILDAAVDAMDTSIDEQIEALRAKSATLTRDMEALASNITDNFERGVSPDALEADMAMVARLRQQIADLSAQIIILTRQKGEAEKAAADAMKPGPKVETQAEKQQRLMQAQLDALRTGGVKAWEDVARAQKLAEGGLSAIQAQMDGLKSDLSDAARFATPFEAWAKEVERLNELLDKGLISAAAYRAAIAGRGPGQAMLDASAPPADLGERVSRVIDEAMEKIAKDFARQLPDRIEGGRDSLPHSNWADIDAILEKQKQAVQGAADALANVFTRIESGDWGAVAEGIGIFQDRLREVEKTGLTGADAMEAVATSLLDSAEAGFAFANMIGKAMGWDQDQQKNAKIGGAIGSAAGQFLPGGKAVWSAVGTFAGGLFGGNSKEDLLAQKLTAERDALAKTINSFLDAGAELSQVGRRVREVNEQFAAARMEAERLSQPLDALTRSYQAQMRAIARGLEEDLADVLDRSEGRGALADYRALVREQEERIQDALIAEVDLSRVRAANAAELSAFFRGLADDQLALFAGVERQVARVQAQVAQLTRTVSTQIDDQIGLYQDLSEQLKSQASTLRGLVKQLRETITGWDIGPDSALGLDEQLSIAGQRFADLVAKARGGDQEAIAGLPDLANTYRDIARQFYGSSEAFFQVEDAIKGALAQVAVVTDARATGIEQLASLSLVQVELLGDLKDLLAADLAQPVADQIAAALADGQLTIGEADAITGALDDLGTRLEGVTGPAAEAARTAVETLNTAVTSGNIAAIAPAMTDLDKTLGAFKTDQIQAYTDALGAVAGTIAAVEKWVLDPDGLIPAAVAAAFKDLKFDQTLNTRIENTFRAAIGVTPLPMPLTGTIRNLVGEVIGTAPLPAALTGTIGDLVNGAVGTATAPAPLTNTIGALVADAVGSGAVGTSATARMEALIEAAISAPSGGWSPAQTLRGLVQGQFSDALGVWGSVPLTQRINDAFNQALGGATGTDWRGTLQSVLASGSPLLTALDGLRAAMVDLRTAVAGEAAGAAGQAAYDAAMQGFVTPVSRAAGTAWGMLTGAKDVDADKGKMTNTVIGVDATTGAELYRGGKSPDATSDARAQGLAGSLSLLAQQIEALTGGDIGTFQVNASDKYGSGYDIGSAQKLQAFGINDFEGIARSFVLDALSQMAGGNAAAIDILKKADLSDFQGGMSKAAQDIYRLLNPPAFAGGGDFGGGLRLVGERGPELEVTGPARYFSAPQTVQMLRAASAAPAPAGGGNAAELSEMRAMNANLVRLIGMQSLAIEQSQQDMRRMADEMARLSSRIDPDRRVA